MTKKNGLPNKKLGRAPGVSGKRAKGVGFELVRKCSTCGVTKPVEKFGVRSSGLHYRSSCKGCDLVRAAIGYRAKRFRRLTTDQLRAEVIKAIRKAELAISIIREREGK